MRKHKSVKNYKKQRMEGLFPTDVWVEIAAHMDPHLLCYMMRMSRRFCHLFISDRAWLAQRNRVCARFPALAATFNACATKVEERGAHLSAESVKRNSNKRRKTAWLPPSRGIWFAFKRWLSRPCTFLGFRELLRISPHKPAVDALIFSALQIHIPRDDRLGACVRSHVNKYFFITMALSSSLSIRFTVWPVATVMRCSISEVVDGQYASLYETSDLYKWPVWWMGGIDPGDLHTAFFKAWEAFILQRVPRSWCGPKFIAFMEALTDVP